MSDDDLTAQEAIADALDQSFEDWANLPETRKLIRESVAGKVKRRTLMKAAHAIGVRDGASMYKATVAMMLGRALGRLDGSTDVDAMLDDVARLRGERDAARRDLCELLGSGDCCASEGHESEAQQRGWEYLYEEGGV